MSAPQLPPGPYAIGSAHWPGLSKLVEENGEAGEALADFLLAKTMSRAAQVLGKLLGTGGAVDHWDGGPPLNLRLEDELADLRAAISFFEEANAEHLNLARMDVRAAEKLALFKKWHVEQRV